MIFVFSGNARVLKTLFPKNTVFADTSLSRHLPAEGDITYFDVSNLTNTEIKKQLTLLKKSCGNTPWGVIDTKGIIKDIAALFFNGASDYLGHGFIKSAKSIEPKRVKSAQVWQKNFIKDSNSTEAARSSSDAGGFLKSGIKLPAANIFPGWNKIQTGKQMPFYLLYCSLQGKVPLETRVDDKTIARIHKKFGSRISNDMKPADGLLWMDTGSDYLFLLPPRVKSAESAIKACVSLLICAPLIVLETFNISAQANFIFALHYGNVNYKPPGKTGTIVSDAVNFIFHLGSKKAAPGRLTLSGELPDDTVPANLQDLFITAGEFEGRKIWHTKKFNYEKAWT